MLEGGILTFFKDSKHSSAGALVSATGPRTEPAPVGQGQHQPDGASTHGTGLHPWDRDSTCRTGTAPMGWGQQLQRRAVTYGRGPELIGQGQHQQDGTSTHRAEHAPTFHQQSPQGQGAVTLRDTAAVAAGHFHGVSEPCRGCARCFAITPSLLLGEAGPSPAPSPHRMQKLPRCRRLATPCGAAGKGRGQANPTVGGTPLSPPQGHGVGGAPVPPRCGWMGAAGGARAQSSPKGRTQVRWPVPLKTSRCPQGAQDVHPAACKGQGSAFPMQTPCQCKAVTNRPSPLGLGAGQGLSPPGDSGFTPPQPAAAVLSTQGNA